MIRLTLSEVAAAVHGRLDAGSGDAGADDVVGDTVVTGDVVADSRQVGPGSLFVALTGERVDGHAFAAGAVASGAIAVLGTRPTGVPTVVVDDAQVALGRLARAVVDALPDLTVVGLTGSNGKTGTKDLLGHLLADLGPTVAPPGNLNNEIGHPLTALRCDRTTRYLVSEMGARMPGNIAYLCGITPPRIAVVLNVGLAHVGVFSSVEVTAATKGELVEALDADGVAVLNADDPLVRAMASRTKGRVVLFGEAEDAAVRAVDVRLDGQARASFTLVGPTGSAPVALQLHGAHHVSNALAAAAVALECGMTPARVAELLGTATQRSRWRMEVDDRADGVTVINDAYNASPDSVRAALGALAAMGTPPSGPARRTWAVLGEMLELGPASEREHQALGRLAADLRIDRLVAIGDGGRPYVDGAEAATTSATGGAVSGIDVDRVPDLEAALAVLRDGLRPGDVVLVKASRGIGLDRLVAALLAAAAADDHGASQPQATSAAVQDDGRVAADATGGLRGEVRA